MRFTEAEEKHYFTKRNIAIVGNNSARSRRLKALAELSGCSIIDDFGIDHIATRNEALLRCDLVVAEFSSNSDWDIEEISKFAGYLIESGVEAIIWTDMENLEEAYANLPTSQCHFLFDGCEQEALLIMSGIRGRGKVMDQLHDTNRDSGFEHLHQISDELADFARKLARIAEKDISGEDDRFSNRVADKPVSYRPAPANINHPFIETEALSAAATHIDIDAKYIRAIIKMRRRRDAYFEAEMFADPAWDILLDLLAARLEGKSVSVSSLCIAASVPATTALRWISSMTEKGNLVRRQDPTDARRIFIDLSKAEADKLMEFFAETAGLKSAIL
jgi:hypothetical protein